MCTNLGDWRSWQSAGPTTATGRRCIESSAHWAVEIGTAAPFSLKARSIGWLSASRRAWSQAKNLSMSLWGSRIIFSSAIVKVMGLLGLNWSRVVLSSRDGMFPCFAAISHRVCIVIYNEQYQASKARLCWLHAILPLCRCRQAQGESCESWWMKQCSSFYRRPIRICHLFLRPFTVAD